MNLDEIKSAWNNEHTGDVNIPKNVDQLGKANHPLDKLKRNMKNEWYLQLIAILTLAFVPQLQSIHPQLYPLYYIAYGFLLIVSVYYLSRFRKFYTKVTHYSTDTKDSLSDIYHEFRLNIERYHAFGFLLSPFAVAWIGIYIYSDLLKDGKDFTSLSEDTKMVLIFAMVTTILLLVVAILSWTKYYYGKYLKQLKSALDELKEN